MKGTFGGRRAPYRVIIAKGEDIRSFAIRPVLAGTLVAIAVLFGGLYLAATAYLVYRDDLLAASLVEQARLRHVYEDRIAELRAQIDRVTSRQVVNQQMLDSKMDRLLGRQATLDARQAALAGLSVMAKRVGIDLPGLADEALATPAGVIDKPLKTGSLDGGQQRHASLNAIGLRTGSIAAELTGDGRAPETRLSAVETSIDQLEQAQLALLGAVVDSASRKSQRISEVLGTLHLHLPADSAVGGPYVPVDEAAAPGDFADAVASAAAEVERLEGWRRHARNLPLLQPVPKAAVTSRFGVRTDPFLKRPSMHSGTDFRAAAGRSVYATAAGRVVAAGRNGGYGNMVEIDHGDGIATRYAHMRRVDVKVGQQVSAGAVLGQVGSTGRSTGPHLHYEVRIDDKPVDPSRFIRAGGELRGLI